MKRRPRGTLSSRYRHRGRDPGAGHRWWILLALVAIAIVGFLGLRRWGGRAAAPRPAATAPAPPATPAIPDSIVALDLETASRRVFELVRAKRWFESLPYYRHIVAQPGANWLAHFDYGTVLHNASVETRPRSGLLSPLTRSSFERVAMMRDALEHYDRALALAPESADRAVILAGRAHDLNAWGFPWDAMTDYRRAAALDPRWREHAAYYERVLRNPTMKFR